MAIGGAKMTKENKLKIAEEAVRIHFDYPGLTVAECIEKAEKEYQDAEDKRDTENDLY